jgi:DNA-directed RNA polymerase specialized sigma24 family protein
MNALDQNAFRPNWPDGESFCLQIRDDPVGLLDHIFPLIHELACWATRRNGHVEHTVDSEDLCQEVVVHLMENDYRRLRTYQKEKASPRTWMNAIVWHLAVALARRHQAELMVRGLADQITRITPEQVLFDCEAAAAVRRAVCTGLTSYERLILESIVTADTRRQPEHVRWGISRNALYIHKSRLIAKLRKKIGSCT